MEHHYYIKHNFNPEVIYSPTDLEDASLTIQSLLEQTSLSQEHILAVFFDGGNFTEGKSFDRFCNAIANLQANGQDTKKIHDRNLHMNGHIVMIDGETITAKPHNTSERKRGHKHHSSFRISVARRG